MYVRVQPVRLKNGQLRYQALTVMQGFRPLLLDRVEDNVETVGNRQEVA